MSARRLDSNSLLAYWQGQEDLFNKRELEILAALRFAKDLTDREIMVALCFEDMNAVRPRITTLLKGGLLVKTGNRIDPLTGKRVRTVSLKRDPRNPQAQFDFKVEVAS